VTHFSLRQLKDHVRNISKGNSNQAQMIIRRYVTERFLERLSSSPLRGNFVLKGGTLISAMIGLENRSTMDLDATIVNVPLSLEDATRLVKEIINVPLADGLKFEVMGASLIMVDVDYPGVRVTLMSIFEDMRIPVKIDFSSGDAITPSEVEYAYPLLFEKRTIPILAYPVETILAEKLETIISRGQANTRMRDYYDIHALAAAYKHELRPAVLQEALRNTSRKRGTTGLIDDAELIFQEIENSPEMASLWDSYRRKYQYAQKLNWEDVVKAVRTLYISCRSVEYF
jgi:predicted nucleotidyltransferase component of viral defense system